MFKTSLLSLNFCLCVYLEVHIFSHYMIWLFSHLYDVAIHFYLYVDGLHDFQRAMHYTFIILNAYYICRIVINSIWNLYLFEANLYKYM